MLEGFVPFPPEYAERYRKRGYWADRSLADELREALAAHGSRTALIDAERSYRYDELDALSDNLALNLLDIGLGPLDRVVPTLPNVAEFVILYLAMQKIGAIPIAALASHRYTEIEQFVRLSGARCCVYAERLGDVAFGPIIERVQSLHQRLQVRIVLGDAGAGEHSLTELIERPASRPVNDLRDIVIDPTDPCIFQLSGGTTGVPKLIPRTGNDYTYNSRIASDVVEVDADSVLLLVLPIAHNLPLACPGIQGFLFHGATVVLHGNTRPEEMCALIERHAVTHLKVVPALLVRMTSAADTERFELGSVRLIQSGGQRMQPEVRLRTRKLFPNAFVQENFGMSEGLLMFVRRDDSEEVKLTTCGRPICADDEVRLIDEEGADVPDGEVGELACRGPYTLRGYFGVSEYNARQFTSDGFYRSGDLMRRHPSGNYIVEGRRKDLINRGGEKISAEEVENLILTHTVVQNVACVPMPDTALGERMCAFVVLYPGTTLTLDELVEFLVGYEIAKFKLPERLETLDELPVSSFGKVSKKALGEWIAAKLARGE